ncbi:MAG: GHKL domain-containing protein [Lachnospiraceae bacterium]|nr:GHKL domain-containing protein [Lachnospiraceae bacterium]
MSEMERYYEIVQIIYIIGRTMIPAYFLVCWVSPFLAEKTKTWRVGAAYAGVSFFLELIPIPVNMMFFYSSLVFAAFLVMIQIDREYIAQKVFLVITFFCMRWQMWRMIACVSNEIFWFLAETFPNENEMFWFVEYAIQTGVEEVLGCLLMYGAVKCMLWAYGRRREHMNVGEFLLLAIPSIFGVVAYGMLRFYNDIYQRDTGQSPWNLYGSYDWITMLYSVLCFVTLLATVYVFRQWKNEQEADKKREVFSRQIQDLESHITEVERLYRDMRKLRHDMGNHLMTLERLYDRGAYEEAEKYAGELRKEVQDISLYAASGNPVTDVIISGKKRQMEEKGIAFDCDFHYPQNEKINAFDISIILQNALSNAIEAVEKENTAHISVTSYFVKNMYMIEVANTYTGELVHDEQSGLPMTSKNGDGHGFGLENIRQAAHKYFGDMEIGKEMYAGEECCVLRVMLQIAE